MPRTSSTTDNPVILAALGVWALLLGMFLLMLGNGLQGTLIGVRASTEGFSTLITSVVMSGYFVGFLAGSKLTPRFIGSVGHLRVFAALASLASIAILIHSLFVDPWIWVLMRFMTGFAFAGVYIVAESWLNDRVTNAHRGGLLSIYMIISYLGLTGGQLLLNLADPELHELFIAISILVSVAAIPILLVVTHAPTIQAAEALGPRRLFRESHLGAVGATVSGITSGALFGMGPVFAAGLGMSIAEISMFMALIVGAGALAQWPIGRLSDHFDRRWVILVAAFTGAITALAAAGLTLVFADRASTFIIAAGMFVGATSLALYPLFSAYTNDRLVPEQMVGAGSTLIMLFGFGAVLGPLLAGQFIERIGLSGFFWLFVATMGGLGAYTWWRIQHGQPIDIAQQVQWTQTPGNTPSLARATAERFFRRIKAKA